MKTLNKILAIKQQIFIVKTSKLTAMCKVDFWVIALKQQKIKINCSVIITKHMRWVLHLNLAI